MWSVASPGHGTIGMWLSQLQKYLNGGAEMEISGIPGFGEKRFSAQMELTNISNRLSPPVSLNHGIMEYPGFKVPTRTIESKSCPCTGHPKPITQGVPSATMCLAPATLMRCQGLGQTLTVFDEHYTYLQAMNPCCDKKHKTREIKLHRLLFQLGIMTPAASAG